MNVYERFRLRVNPLYRKVHKMPPFRMPGGVATGPEIIDLTEQEAPSASAPPAQQPPARASAGPAVKRDRAQDTPSTVGRNQAPAAPAINLAQVQAAPATERDQEQNTAVVPGATALMRTELEKAPKPVSDARPSAQKPSMVERTTEMRRPAIITPRKKNVFLNHAALPKEPFSLTTEHGGSNQVNEMKHTTRGTTIFLEDSSKEDINNCDSRLIQTTPSKGGCVTPAASMNGPTTGETFDSNDCYKNIDECFKDSDEMLCSIELDVRNLKTPEEENTKILRNHETKSGEDDGYVKNDTANKEDSPNKKPYKFEEDAKPRAHSSSDNTKDTGDGDDSSAGPRKRIKGKEKRNYKYKSEGKAQKPQANASSDEEENSGDSDSNSPSSGATRRLARVSRFEP